MVLSHTRALPDGTRHRRPLTLGRDIHIISEQSDSNYTNIKTFIEKTIDLDSLDGYDFVFSFGFDCSQCKVVGKSISFLFKQ